MSAQGRAMSVLQAGEARVRAMWARALEPSGASRRWMEVGGLVGMRTKVSESMVIAKRFFHACGGGWLQVSSWDCKEGAKSGAVAGEGKDMVCMLLSANAFGTRPGPQAPATLLLAPRH